MILAGASLSILINGGYKGGPTKKGRPDEVSDRP